MLGCLVEKQLTTPQQYPLTRNALVLACSQTTNREPVMTLGEDAVGQALDELKGLHLVRFVLPSHGKSVTRYRHIVDETYGLDGPRAALLAVLLLRGPQTVGELRSRTARMAQFDSLGAVQAELEVLADRADPLAQLLPRQPGQKEDRWQQLLAVEPNGPTTAAGPDPIPRAEMADGPSRPAFGGRPDQGAPAVEPVAVGGDPDDLGSRVRALMSEVAALRGQVTDLGESLDALRRSLGE